VTAEPPGERLGEQFQIDIVSDRVNAPGVRDSVSIEVTNLPPDLHQRGQVEVPETHLGRAGVVELGVGAEIYMKALRQWWKSLDSLRAVKESGRPGDQQVQTGKTPPVYFVDQLPQGVQRLLSDVPANPRALQSRMPDVQVWTKDEFSRQARNYWLQQTGAGGTVITSAVLGFIIGLLIASQTIYAVTIENIEEFATLKALGASRSYIARVVLIEAIGCGTVGCGLAAAIAGPVVHAATSAITWILMPTWLPFAVFVPGLVMSSTASLISVGKALLVDPAKVFRV
jgi:putative ABC transport system permease protein